MRLYVMCVMLFAAVSVHAADYILNLAEQQPGTTNTVSVDGAVTSVTVTILNMVPTAKYNVTVERAVVPIPALDTAPLQPATAGARASNAQCTALVAAFNALVAVKEESGVASAASALRDALASVDWRSCEDEALNKAFHPDPPTLLASTQKVVTSPIRMGESVTVRVERVDPAKVWTAVYTTGARGSWSTSYGFGYVRNRDQEFYSASQDGGKFVITPKARRRGQDIVPQVYFNWVDRDDDLRNLTIRFGAGIGYDSTAPVISIGAFLTYNRNLSVIAGVMAQRQKRLSGKYQPNQVITENLDDTQLHETVIRPNFFIGASFRLSSNIFRPTPTAPATPPSKNEPAAPTRP